MADFKLTKIEKDALRAIMTRYAPKNERLDRRKRSAIDYVGWYRKANIVKTRAAARHAEKTGANWKFSTPSNSNHWKVNGAFVKELIERATGVRVEKSTRKWPSPDVLNGDGLYLYNLDIQGEVTLENLKPSKGDKPISLHFKNTLIKRLVALDCAFGDVHFEECRAKAIITPFCKFDSLKFSTVPQLSKEVTEEHKRVESMSREERREHQTQKREEKNDVLDKRLKALEEQTVEQTAILQNWSESIPGAKSEHESIALSIRALENISAKTSEEPIQKTTFPSRGVEGIGDFGVIFSPDIKVENDVIFEGIRITGLSNAIPKNDDLTEYKSEYDHLQRCIANRGQDPRKKREYDTKKYLFGVGYTDTFQPPISLILDNAKLNGNLIFRPGGSKNAWKAKVNERNSKTLRGDTGARGVLPFIAIGGASLRGIRNCKTVNIIGSWFCAPEFAEISILKDTAYKFEGDFITFENWRHVSDKSIMMSLLNSMGMDRVAALDLRGAIFENLQMIENELEAKSAILNMEKIYISIQKGGELRRKGNQENLSGILDQAMMARPLCLGALLLDEARFKLAEFSGIVITNTLSLKNLVVNNTIRMRTNYWTCRLGYLALEDVVSIVKPDDNELSMKLIFNGVVYGSGETANKVSRRPHPKISPATNVYQFGDGTLFLNHPKLDFEFEPLEEPEVLTSSFCVDGLGYFLPNIKHADKTQTVKLWEGKIGNYTSIVSKKTFWGNKYANLYSLMSYADVVMDCKGTDVAKRDKKTLLNYEPSGNEVAFPKMDTKNGFNQPKYYILEAIIKTNTFDFIHATNIEFWNCEFTDTVELIVPSITQLMQINPDSWEFGFAFHRCTFDGDVVLHQANINKTSKGDNAKTTYKLEPSKIIIRRCKAVDTTETADFFIKVDSRLLPELDKHGMSTLDKNGVETRPPAIELDTEYSEYRHLNFFPTTKYQPNHYLKLFDTRDDNPKPPSAIWVFLLMISCLFVGIGVDAFFFTDSIFGEWVPLILAPFVVLIICLVLFLFIGKISENVKKPQESGDEKNTQQALYYLAKTLRREGKNQIADRVAVAGHRQRAKSKQERGFAKWMDNILSVTSDFGYSPGKAFLAVILVWVWGTIFMSAAAVHGVFVPTSTITDLNGALQSVQFTVPFKSWNVARGCASLNVPVWAFDDILPIIGLGQTKLCAFDPQGPGAWAWTAMRALYTLIGAGIFAIFVMTITGALRGKEPT
ncbi:MAG: hypothetical protein COA43_04915 [Robiginitomaculum sp.]|nr:MAG: hypothetical protein COA43_04915 [Robiginitomaculum sp.]